MYSISAYTKRQAKKLGVQVRKSTSKGKKLDVYKNGKKVASIGALGYKDYPSFIKSHGKAYADKRRSAYKKRHSKDRSVKGSRGYYADRLLW
jgi:endonuclease III-like uncharacterized protein